MRDQGQIEAGAKGIERDQRATATFVRAWREAKLLTLQGVNALQDQKLDDALGFFQRAIEQGPELPTGYYYLGLTRERKGDAGQALTAFEKALELKPDYAQAHSSLGLLYWRQNDQRRALEEFRQAVMSDPDLAEAHYNLGLALAQSGSLDEAAQRAEGNAIVLIPHYTDARVQLGLALGQKNDTPALRIFSANSCAVSRISRRVIIISDWCCCRLAKARSPWGATGVRRCGASQAEVRGSTLQSGAGATPGRK